MSMSRKVWAGLGLLAVGCLVVGVIMVSLCHVPISEKEELGALAVTSSQLSTGSPLSVEGTVANKSSLNTVTDRYVVAKLVNPLDNQVMATNSWHIDKLGPGQEQDFTITFSEVDFDVFTSSGWTYEVSIE